MKNRKIYVGLFFIIIILIGSQAGCGAGTGGTGGSGTATTDTSSAAATTATNVVNNPVDDSSFTYSDGIDDNGYWYGVKALDYVTMFDYKGMTIPSDAHTVTDSDVQSQIDSILTSYATKNQVKDRAVADGDTVNIDYVGSVDGIKFDGGSTGGTGTNVTAGSGQYIGDFLQQLIGHMPGETFDINVTFPDDYSEASLQGKAAVFNTTINYIEVDTPAVLNDDFVMTNLNSKYGWKTVDDMKTGIRNQIQTSGIDQFIEQYFTTNVTVSSVPDLLVKYQQKFMVKYYSDMAASYGVDLNTFITSYLGAASVDDLVQANADNNLSQATCALVTQAIAEDAKLSVSDDDMSSYFAEQTGSSDYSQFQTMYGLPYLKQAVLSQKVLDLITQNATLAPPDTSSAAPSDTGSAAPSDSASSAPPDTTSAAPADTGSAAPSDMTPLTPSDATLPQ